MTTKYIATTLKLSPIQKQKISYTVKNKKGVSVNDLNGNNKIMLTPQQIAKIKKAKAKGVGVNIKLSKIQYLQNQGGFLPTLLRGLAASLLPNLLGLFGKGLHLPGNPVVKSGGSKKKQQRDFFGLD